MKIFERIKTGKLKGWTIRVSKHGWYDLYSSSGISQTTGKHTLEAIRKVIKDLENENTIKKPMSNKKETPVSWLMDKLFQDFGVAFPDNIGNRALQMESQKQQKYDEMLAMLEEAERTLREVFDCDTEKALQLIKEAKEL
jgi:hypothetical protein